MGNEDSKPIEIFNPDTYIDSNNAISNAFDSTVNGTNDTINTIDMGTNDTINIIDTGTNETINTIDAGTNDTMATIDAGWQDTATVIDVGWQDTTATIDAGWHDTTATIDTEFNNTTATIDAGWQENIVDVISPIGQDFIHGKYSPIFLLANATKGGGFKLPSGGVGGGIGDNTDIVSMLMIGGAVVVGGMFLL